GEGENNIIIMASSSPCNLTPLDNSIEIRSESIYQIGSVNGGSSCKAGSVTLTAEGAPANGSYKWYSSALDTDPIIETDESLFTTPVLEKTQTYFVAAVNGAGCEGEREAVVAEVVNYDEVLIVEKNDTFSSSYTSGNQWFKDGVIIPGATNQSFKPESSGVYKVEVNFGSCSTSAERSFVVTGVEDEFLDGKIIIYPNPTEGDLIIEFHDLTLESPVIVDMMGRKIADIPVRIENGKTIGKFDFSSHPAGVYLLQVVDAMGRVYSKRISKK
ncbi:MAG: T9SS type A sorting domain-containing protein, partial [Cyclobacteriaceae bacterium]